MSHIFEAAHKMSEKGPSNQGCDTQKNSIPYLSQSEKLMLTVTFFKSLPKCMKETSNQGRDSFILFIFLP